MAHKNQKPTEAELEILQVLWERGAATVKEVHERLSVNRPTVYTTVLKTMQIMTEKKLVEPDKRSKAHVYRAVVERRATQKRFAGDLLQKLFGGSAAQLVMSVLETEPASEAELREIRRMLDEAEKSAGKQESDQ